MGDVAKGGEDVSLAMAVRPTRPSAVRVEGPHSPKVFVFPLASVTSMPMAAGVVAGGEGQQRLHWVTHLGRSPRSCTGASHQRSPRRSQHPWGLLMRR